MTSQDIQITARGAAPQPSTQGCGCCGPSIASTDSEAATEGASSATYHVNGMTCGHCVRAVTQEIEGLEGVTDVDIDLVAGGTSVVAVRSRTALSDDAVTSAIAEAGYEVVAPA